MAKRKIDFTVRDAWDQDSLLLYKEAVSRYPYCAPARLCFLLNLRALDDPDYERELTLTALSVPDRQRLRTEVEAVEARLAAARPEKENRWGRSVTARKAAGAGAVASGRRMTEGLGGARQAALADGERAEGVAAALGRAVDFGAVAANEPAGRRGGEAIVSRPVAVPEPAIVSRPAPEPEPAIVSRPASEPEPAIVSRPAPEPEPEPEPSETLPEILQFEPLVEDDYIEMEARSRSPRRNARRLVRRHGIWAAQRQAFAESERAVEQPDDASAVTISMLFSAPQASDPLPEPPVSPQPDLLVPMPKAPSPMRLFKRRRRPEAFNPWAEVFTSKNTLSDSLQSVAVAPSDPTADAGLQPAAPSVAANPAQAATVPQAVAPVQPAAPSVAANPAQAATPRRRPSPTAPKPAVPKPAPIRAAAPKRSTRRPVVSAAQPASPAQPATPVPSYIDPNELIDRFLRKNDDHILIQVDETRDYSVFDPDRGSLREDWSMGSETLAQLYLKQGAPDKAIEIYRYLGLKFPEKKRYFAGLIRTAENAKGRK